MAQFVDPKAVLKTDFTDIRALERAVRQALAAEEEAVSLYETIADSTDVDIAKKVLQDIADEEKVHAGELYRLLEILTDGEESDFFQEGVDEVDEGKVASIAGRVAHSMMPRYLGGKDK